MPGAGRAMLVGAMLGLVLIVVVASMALLGVPPFPSSRPHGSTDSVVVGLLLPDAQGVVAPRVVDVYTRSGGSWSVRSVAPSSSVTVVGTSGSTVADAYSFGGGAGLAQSVDGLVGVHGSDWVLVGPDALAAAVTSSTITVEMPQRVEVFDGSRLYPFGSGETTVTLAEVPLLLEGVAYLPAGDAVTVREQLGDALRAALSAGIAGSSGLTTDLPRTVLGEWLAQARNARRMAAISH